MSLHPFVYIVLGLVVAISSLFQRQMILFVFIGVGILIYGLIKQFKKPKERVSPSLKQQHSRISHPAHNNHQTHHHVSMQHKYKTCPNCKHVISRSARFCPHCGYGV